MDKRTLQSTQSFEESSYKINHRILTVTFESVSIPMFCGFKSYLKESV
jgi:hypothetical protein